MRNILKNFTRPQADAYVFPETDELTEPQEAESPPEAPPEAPPAPPGQKERAAPASSPTSPVDFAKIQAEAIMEDAKMRAREFMEKAHAQAADAIEQDRQQARQEGYRDGYAEGLSKAMVEAKREREEQALELELRVQRFLEDASRAREELMVTTADELRDLCIAIAEKVVRVSLKSSGEIIARMIQAATEKLKRREWVHIYVAGCDARGMAQVTPALTASLSALSDHVKIIPMAGDESGTCIIEMPDQIMDASVSTQFSNIRSVLEDATYDNLPYPGP